MKNDISRVPRISFNSTVKKFVSEKMTFDGYSTALQVLYGKDLSGKVALITGANAGIGFETARSLALHNCEVIFGCRNEKLARDAIRKIFKEKADVKCTFIKLDLSSLKDTKMFCDNVKQKFKQIDYLILNAGLFPPKYTKSPDNVELTFQVSHLSHFYLTMELSDLMNRNSRVVLVSSEAHFGSLLSSSDWDEQTVNPTYCNYWRPLVYPNVKLFNVLFARELAKRWKDRGISVFSLHPGRLMATNFASNWWPNRILFSLFRPFAKSLVSFSWELKV